MLRTHPFHGVTTLSYRHTLNVVIDLRNRQITEASAPRPAHRHRPECRGAAVNPSEEGRLALLCELLSGVHSLYSSLVGALRGLLSHSGSC